MRRTRGMSYDIRRDENQQTRHPHPFKSPQRITITIPNHAYEHLMKRSNEEGRSLSNLAAYLLETAIGKQTEKT
jgi:hypothetical protein